MAKNIILLSTGLDPDGAENQLVQMALRLKSRGWAVKVVSMLPPSASSATLIELLGAAQVPLESLGMQRGSADLMAVWKLATLLRQEKPQVLHAHMVHANLLARIVRLLAPVPVVVTTAHNIDEGSRMRERAYRLTDSLANVTTQVSQAGLERYIALGITPAHKMRFIPNGVDTQRYQPDARLRQQKRDELGLGTEFMWLAAGRLTEAKDFPNLLQAFAQAHQTQPTARLMIAGQGELKEELHKLTAELGLSNAVRWLGRRSDLNQLMCAADAYVMSSAWEGMPLVLLEATSIGLPVVATDVGGNREVVQDGQTGFLVPAKNSSALAGAMLKFMALPTSARAAMGQAGRAFILQHYDLEPVMDQWEDLYAELLGKKSAQIA